MLSSKTKLILAITLPIGVILLIVTTLIISMFLPTTKKANILPSTSNSIDFSQAAQFDKAKYPDADYVFHIQSSIITYDNGNFDIKLSGNSSRDWLKQIQSKAHYTTEKETWNIQSCPDPEKNQIISYDEYTINNVEIKTKNTIKVSKYLSIYDFILTARCELKYSLEKSEIIYDTATLYTCMGDFTAANYAIQQDQKLLISYNTQYCSSQGEKKSHFLESWSTDGGKTWDTITDIRTATNKSFRSESTSYNKAGYPRSVFEINGPISDEDFRYYQYMAQFFEDGGFISVLNRGDNYTSRLEPWVKDFEVKQSQVIFAMNSGKTKCLQEPTPESILENICGRKLVYQKTSQNTWTFDLKSSIDSMKVPSEIQNLKTNWNDETAQRLSKTYDIKN
jgi:hypothetical protein